MSLISRRIALAIAILFTTWSRAQVPAASNPNEQSDQAAIESLPKGLVSGQVLDASTGKPISGVRVELSWIQGRCTPYIGGLPLPRCARGSTYIPRFEPVITGVDGTFQFPSVPFGNVNVHAQLKGFIDAESLRRRPDSLSGLRRVGTNSTGIEFRLIRRAVVHGLIVDELGHPCAGWEIQYHSILLTQGRYAVESPGTIASTAVDGTFRVEAGGHFYLTTTLHTASPDSAGHPQAYPVVLWPAPDTPILAGQVELGTGLAFTRHAEPGTDISAKITVRPSRLHHVTGIASTTETSHPPPIVYPVPRFGLPIPLGNASSGRIDLWLPVGDYTLEAMSQNEWTRVPLSLTGRDIADISIRTHRPASVPIHLIRPSGADDDQLQSLTVPLGFDLALMEENPVGVVNSAGVTRAHANGDEYVVDGLLPGKYDATTQAPFDDYVASISAGNVDLSSHPYVVPEDGAITPITVVLRRNGGTLTGAVRKDGRLMDAYIYMIPLFPSTAAPISGFSRTDGTYRLNHIPPGAYRIVALDAQEWIPYREPDAMKPWLLRGTPIRIHPDSVVTADLEVEQE